MSLTDMPALLADPVTTKRTTKLFSHSIKRFLAWIQGSPVDKNVILRDLLLADLLASFLRSFLAEMWSVLLFLARPYCSYQSNLDGDAVGDPSAKNSRESQRPASCSIAVHALCRSITQTLTSLTWLAVALKREASASSFSEKDLILSQGDRLAGHTAYLAGGRSKGNSCRPGLLGIMRV